MTSFISMPLVRHTGVFVAAILLAAGVTQAQQSTASNDAPAASSYSSSQSGLGQFQLSELAAPALPASSAASPGGGAAGQYGTSGGGHGFHGMFHHWTFEAGLGGNAPTGEDTHETGVFGPGALPVITWGGNFTLGGGLRFNNRFSVLAEYQFMDDKLPGPYISAENAACQAYSNCAASGITITAGNTHINSITASPVFDLTPKRSNGIYAVGGAGWYHKSTNFQAPELTFDYYYGYIYQNVTATSFSSNQWGANGGLGLYHRFSNVYGDTNHTEFFAEARYLYIHTPPVTQPTGIGITELIPFTIGIRF